MLHSCSNPSKDFIGEEPRARLTDTEYARIQNYAANCGLNISYYSREFLREEPSLRLFKAGFANMPAGLPMENAGISRPRWKNCGWKENG